MRIATGLAGAVIASLLSSCAGAGAGSEADLIKLENDWSQATVARDGARLSRFYADDYVFTDADGALSTKSKEIEEITSGLFHETAYKFDDLQVRFFGEVAVVTGRNTIRGTWEDTGQTMNGPYRFTDVFVMRDGGWQCVASQASRVERE